MISIQLSNTDSRLTFLALQYHLARPGAELSSETMQPAARGLKSVAEELEPQLDQAVATIEIDDHQHERLVSAVAGTFNELKTYGLLSAGGGTSVPGFDATLKRLFPEVAGAPDETERLAGHMLTLRRRLEGAAKEAEAERKPAQRSSWRFWERKRP